jgi:uncharacterized protein YfaS (alpha-2-macroglobulin family)
MHFNRMILWLAVAMLFLAAGCGGAPAPTATPTSEPPARSLPTDTPAPSPTIPPTPTRAPLPPAVIGIAPDRGQEQVLAAPVTITFDQPMDPASTGAAFSIEPKVPGEVQVKGNQLIFSPTERLQRGAEYRVSLGATASSAAGLRLPQPVSFKFKTAGLLQVTSVQPMQGAEGAPVDAALIVAFNRPVATLGDSATAALPLVITPTVTGAGEWLTTSIYRFTPAGGLAAATAYTVAVPAGLADTTGGLLTEPYTFTFRTTDPAVRRWDFVRASRRDGTDNVTPASPISATFSLPMERAATEAAFRLVEITPQGQPTGTPLAGVFTWNADGTMLGFKPAKALTLGTRYRASVAATARPANGQGALRAAVSRDFTTVFPPRITRTLPVNGDTRVTPGGGVSIQFASPISPASLVSGTITVLPKPTRVFTTYSEWDNTLYLNLDKLPDTAYTVTLSGKIADPYGNLLGQDFVLRFVTRQYDSFVQLYSTGPVGTYNAYTATTAAVTYRNVPQISFGLWNLPDNEFIALAGQGFWDKWRSYAPKPANLRREWQYETSAARNQIGVAVTRLEDREGAALPPGLYYLVVDSETAQIVDQTETPGSQRQLIARTTANVTLKAWAGGALAWVTDLKSGQPVAGAEVRFTDGLGVDQRATTNREGIAEVTFDRPRQPWVTLLALARTTDGGFGVASTGWTAGIAPWDFRVNSDSSTDPFNGVVYTDRPIYRPGQTVYWKAIIRRDNDAIYALPAAGQPVTVTINDGEGKTLWIRPVTLDGMGAAHGSLALDADASLGYYQISVRIPDPQPTKERDGTYVSMGFQVAEYRKPEYEVSAQTDRTEYTQGEQIQTTIQANYFFGQPVKGATVRWTLLSSDFAFQLPEERPGGPYSFGDWDWYATARGLNFGGALSQGEGITDAAGRATFTVPADITKFSQSQRFTFDITILDTNGQTVSTQAGAIVHKGAFYIGLRPQSYVSTASKPVTIDVLTVNPQGKPEPETNVEVIANRIRWYSVRERAEDGNYYWNSRAEKTPVFTQTMTTGTDGTAVFTFTPDEAGEYKIEATGRDRAGHMIRSATYAWVSGRAYTAWRQENNDRIQLIADKKEYKPGETARLLVASPYQTPVKALLTIERGGILTRTVIDVRGNSELLEIPIRPDFAPDVFASLLLIKGIDETAPAPTFKMGLAALKVSVADKQLQVVLTPRGQGSGVRGQEEPLRVGPREKVVWEVRTLDAAGKPVQAEVSLALVDKAVLSLVEGPEGNTDTLLSRFYRERGLGVTTAATLVMNVDRLINQLAEGGKGGGGGGDGGGDLTVRREFPDTAYWNAAVRTGPDGTAQIELTLPDSLTTWTMDARAVTADTKVGQARADIIATKDLLVRPVLPRFFIAGDQAELAAIVHNNTKAEVKAEVKIEASGLQVGAATQPRREATIKAGDTAKIVWPVTVAGNADGLSRQVTVTMAAVEAVGADGRPPLRDAVEITLPVYRYTTPETVGSSGQVAVGESRLELVRLPAGADQTAGELVVQLEASLAAGMRGGLTYLEHYPYECTEQTVSRFLPNVVSYQALKKLGQGGASSDIETKLAQQVGVGLQRLYAGQHTDGGWGWWPKDESAGTVSAYVVLGLAKAKQAGFTVDETALARGARYLKDQLAAPADLTNWQLNQQAFLLYALAEAGAREPNRAGALYEQRERLSLYAKGYLALALGLLGDGASASRLQTLLADITSRAITSGTATHWEEAWPDLWNMNSDTRTTAILLDVLARHAVGAGLGARPDAQTSASGNPPLLAPNAVRWLMTARRADRWETTQENAWAIIALTDWMVATGELNGDYAWRVLLNNAALGQGQVTPATVGDVTTLRAEVGASQGGATPPLLPDQTNALMIQRAATADQLGKETAVSEDKARGQLYYTVQVRSYQPVEKIGPVNRGVIISREYRLAECGQKECPPITAARVGDVIDVRLRIIAPQQLHYLIVEDPLPAGAEAIDTSLRTTSITARGPDAIAERVTEKGEDQSDWRWWGWWTPTHVDLRDEKTALFATWLEPGSYEFRYQIRASLPGQFRLLPPTAYQMYQPEVWGRGAGGVFTIEE